jgi:hypothetical protein
VNIPVDIAENPFPKAALPEAKPFGDGLFGRHRSALAARRSQCRAAQTERFENVGRLA